MDIAEFEYKFERKSQLMNKRRIGLGKLLVVTTIIILGFTITAGAIGEEPGKEEAPIMVMERVRDFFSGDNLDIFQDTKERVEELGDSIGRGTEKIGESIEKLTDFLGFDNPDSDEEELDEETEQDEQENVSTGQIAGNFKTTDGESLENIRVNAGNYATYTDNSGEFVFDNIPYGVYTLTYQESEDQALINIEEIRIDSDNDRYVISLILDTKNEIIVDSSTEAAPEAPPEGGETEDPEKNVRAGLIIFAVLILLGILLFLLIKRKHIKIIDAKTGETLRKKNIDIKPVTWIDLTEEVQSASYGKIRVLFMRSAINKLYGKKIIFTVEDQMIGEIPEYTGELDFLIEKRSDRGTSRDSEADV